MDEEKEDCDQEDIIEADWGEIEDSTVDGKLLTTHISLQSLLGCINPNLMKLKG